MQTLSGHIEERYCFNGFQIILFITAIWLVLDLKRVKISELLNFYDFPNEIMSGKEEKKFGLPCN